MDFHWCLFKLHAPLIMAAIMKPKPEILAYGAETERGEMIMSRGEECGGPSYIGVGKRPRQVVVKT